MEEPFQSQCSDPEEVWPSTKSHSRVPEYLGENQKLEAAFVSMLDWASSTRVEERPREFVSSKKEPNGRDAAEIEPFENTSCPPISVVDFRTGRRGCRR